MTTIDDYLKTQPEQTRKILEEMRKLIHSKIPDVSESISYGLPTFKIDKKPLIYFAGWKDHVAIYPTDSKLETEISEVVKYRTGKGTLKFPLSETFPLNLLEEIVSFRLQELQGKK